MWASTADPQPSAQDTDDQRSPGGASLAAQAVNAHPGPEWCREWTAAVDATVRDGLAALGTERGVAVVALGGYARRELCPASDVDLLLLHDGWSGRELEGLVEKLCYPLWDAGLSVGHGVRTAKEAVRAAGDRVDSATALADRRLVAGDVGLLDDLASRAGRWLRRKAGWVLSSLDESDAARRADAGPHAGMLEPDLKAGSGGLRDIHSLRWAAACLLGEVGLDPLVGARYLHASERRELAEAESVLLEARCGLHLVQGPQGRGAPRERLRLDLQDEVAERLGAEDADHLLHRVGLAMRVVAHLHGRSWPRLLADGRGGRRRRQPSSRVLDEGVWLDDGLVAVAGDHSLAADHSLGMRAVAAAARHRTHLDRRSAARLRRATTELGALTWSGAAREALVTALHRGRQALPVFADADQIGLMTAYLPQWPVLRGRPQRNPVHRYDLDTHGWEALAELVAVSAGSVDERHQALWEGLDAPEAALLAAWLHDVGKAWPGDHSAVGGQVAEEWVSHMGFAPAIAARVRSLVEHHLLLADVATRRDLDDQAELTRVAEAVGDLETLDALYLISLADGRATGPAATSAWRDWLLDELHGRVRALLAGEGASLRAAIGPEAATSEARRRLADEPAELEALDELLPLCPSRYLLAADGAQLAAHVRLISQGGAGSRWPSHGAPAAGQVALRAAVREGPAEDTAVLDVAASDRLGLMADCAGVLAAHGVGVLEARAFTTADGLALDWFVVDGDAADDWTAVIRALGDVGAGELDVDAQVARRERRRDVRPPVHLPEVAVRITPAQEPDEDATRIEVRGPDSPGILYRLAHTLAARGLDVAGSRVATLGDEARDVFFVKPFDVSGELEALSDELRAAAAWPSR